MKNYTISDRGSVYTKGDETKRNLILHTYKKLYENDASSITVREITKEAGISAAALYRHFDSLEYLIAVASVRFLDEYMKKYAVLLDCDKNFLDIYLEGWELFNHYAFERPDIYYRLFWGIENNVFGAAFQDYFELFPFSGSEKHTAHYYILLFNENMRERDRMTLRKLVNDHIITDDEADFFSYTNTLIVEGLLHSAMKEKEEKRGSLEKLCNSLIRKNMARVRD
ncbi:MAG TPA: hypothetical protein DCZ61_01740 [Lachnospiraceae bacterium]|jgi:AcrR family transcriptional regulator|nr:TetR/AcrR family transcriptional regulator [Lachnospiraceae bacterium]HBB60499.1 hypothetical protein [Lachnospiraceae bacterium]